MLFMLFNIYVMTLWRFLHDVFMLVNMHFHSFHYDFNCFHDHLIFLFLRLIFIALFLLVDLGYVLLLPLRGVVLLVQDFLTLKNVDLMTALLKYMFCYLLEQVPDFGLRVVVVVRFLRLVALDRLFYRGRHLLELRARPIVLFWRLLF